jgi:OPT family oligopeptide transporter
MSLNPGPFNVKEHVCITVMGNVAVVGSYATDIFASQKIFYGQDLSFAYQILLDIGTQTMGFAFGGLLRQFVVWPASMIWPSSLVSSALFNTLHKSYGHKEGNHMSREKFFLLVCAGSFVYYWLPGYLFTALSMFSWVCWIKPDNVVVNALFGVNTGLGMGLLTFDWSMVSYLANPLVTPWWSELNTFVAMVILLWIVVPIIYCAYFPRSLFLQNITHN